MKHLNPRQGITTKTPKERLAERTALPCETPKSPPGDYNTPREFSSSQTAPIRVKHLNPRQGITTRFRRAWLHLASGCETPKSPPGDYNGSRGLPLPSGSRNRPCETPKSPPGDYNFCHILVDKTLVDTRNLCETPKSPPGDYNPGNEFPGVPVIDPMCETPKSPPGDYNAAAARRLSSAATFAV